MKQTIDRRKPKGLIDYLALALTTFGVGYIPGAPGTYGSVLAVAIYMTLRGLVVEFSSDQPTARLTVETAFLHALIATALVVFVLIGIWASSRSIEMLGNSDPSEAVVDEVMGQLITFLFIPFTLGYGFIFAGFLLFRLFDIWKPYPIDSLQNLPAGIGVCADDILAGVYAGVCLAVIYAVSILV